VQLLKNPAARGEEDVLIMPAASESFLYVSIVSLPLVVTSYASNSREKW